MHLESSKQTYKLNKGINDLHKPGHEIIQKRPILIFLLSLTILVALLTTLHLFQAFWKIVGSTKYGALEALKNIQNNPYLQIIMKHQDVGGGASGKTASGFVSNKNFFGSIASTMIRLNEENIAKYSKIAMAHSISSFVNNLIGGSNRRAVYALNFGINYIQSGVNALYGEDRINHQAMECVKRGMNTLYSINFTMFKNVLGWLRKYDISDLSSILNNLNICLHLLGSRVSKIHHIACKAPTIDISKVSEDDQLLALFEVTKILMPNNLDYSCMDVYKGKMNDIFSLYNNQFNELTRELKNVEISLDIPWEQVLWSNILHVYKFISEISGFISTNKNFIIPDHEFMSELESEVINIAAQYNRFNHSLGRHLSTTRLSGKAAMDNLKVNQSEDNIYDHMTRLFKKSNLLQDVKLDEEFNAFLKERSIPESLDPIKEIKRAGMLYMLHNTMFVDKDKTLEDICFVLDSALAKNFNLSQVLKIKCDETNFVHNSETEKFINNLQLALANKANYKFTDVAALCSRYTK